VADGFKRLNFFKGFFTQAEDWQAGEEYHIERRKLHNRYLHTPGIVPGCLSELKVTASDNGKSLTIESGYAIDGQGRDLFLPGAEKIRIVPKDYKLPGTVYIVIRYSEELEGKRDDKANPEYSGYAYVREKAIIEIAAEEPAGHQAIELARISLSKEALAVSDPKDPRNPGPNDVDRRYIKKAGAGTGSLKLDDIGKVVASGEINLPPGQTPEPGNPGVRIDLIKGADRQRFYMASVYPSDGGRIQWRIESFARDGSIEYWLFFTNFEAVQVKAFYRVYGLN
jgi:hypothetical protein